MGKALYFIYDGMTDFEMTFACHLLKMFADNDEKKQCTKHYKGE